MLYDLENPKTSTFYEVRHNMAILTYYETVYITKIVVNIFSVMVFALIY